MEMPSGLEFYTADEIAECFPGIDEELYSKLWNFVAEAKNPTPLGGDGSEGTVEEPAGRLNLENDDKTPHWWDILTETQQRAIIEGYRATI